MNASCSIKGHHLSSKIAIFLNYFPLVWGGGGITFYSVSYFTCMLTIVHFPSIQPVCHYTLASIYLSLHDYVASTIHLRAALHTQPSFDHALSALKFVRCSMKFKEEKAQLRKKVGMYSYNYYYVYIAASTSALLSILEDYSPSMPQFFF